MMRQPIIALLLVLMTASFAFAADEADCVISLGAGTGYGSLETTGWVPVTMTVPEAPCSKPATVVLNVEFNSTKLEYVDAGLGLAVCDISKSLTAQETDPGVVTVVIFGVNTTTMGSGNLVWVGFRALEGVVADESVPVRITEASASSPDSDNLACSISATVGSFTNAALPEGITQGPECDSTPLEGDLSAEGQSAEGQVSEGDVLLDGEGGEGDQGDGGDTTDTSGCAGISLATGGPSAPGSGGPGAFALALCAFLLIAAFRKQCC